MPLKNGRLTAAERGVAAEMANTGSPAFAATKTGLSLSGVRQALARPAVQAEIARQHNEMLFRDILPLAVAAHKRLLSDPRTPAGATVQAVKLAYDRTLGSEEGARSKEPHEMTPEELAEAIATLSRIASDRARPVLEGSASTIDEEPEPSIFG